MRQMIVKSPMEEVERFDQTISEPVLVNRYGGTVNGINVTDGIATILFDCTDEVAEKILNDPEMGV